MYVDQQYINLPDRVTPHKLWTIMTCDARKNIEIVDRQMPKKLKRNERRGARRIFDLFPIKPLKII
jgi:hypothetical protein